MQNMTYALEERISDPSLFCGRKLLKSGIPDDILNFIFRELYQTEIDLVSPDIGSELAQRVEALEREKESLRGASRIALGVWRRAHNAGRVECSESCVVRSVFRSALNAQRSAPCAPRTVRSNVQFLFKTTWDKAFAGNIDAPLYEVCSQGRWS